MTPRVIYEDRNFIVIDKPAGLMVHAARISSARRVDKEKAAEPTVADWLRKNYPEVATVGDDPAQRPGIVHRLDKETSGVMIVARTQHSFEYLKSLFQNRGIKKTYLALVSGVPEKESGTIDAPIGIINGTLKRSIHSEKMAKPAVTDYSVIKILADGSEALLEVSPKTGRTHQIRVHLASIGHPIAGDRLYGQKKNGKRGTTSERLMLHAKALAFSDEDGNRYVFEADIPPEFSYPQQ